MTSITDPRLQAVVESIPEWQGCAIHAAPLSGGLTNNNFRVEVDGQPCVVRIPGESTELLAIDRENEHANSVIAASLGVGPQVLHYLPDQQITVMEFLDGQTMSQADMQQPGMPSRVAATIKRLHDGPKFFKDFDMLTVTDFYWDVIRRSGFAPPAGMDDQLAAIDRIYAALAAAPPPLVACHNDLLAENFILTGDELKVVDFEYSGNSDPCFELGNFAQEQEYTPAQFDELCSAYFGKTSPEMIARTKLNMIVSDVAWSLWAMIQHNISKVDFDFHAYGTDRWRRARAKLTATAELDRWLDEV